MTAGRYSSEYKHVYCVNFGTVLVIGNPTMKTVRHDLGSSREMCSGGLKQSPLTLSRIHFSISTNQITHLVPERFLPSTFPLFKKWFHVWITSLPSLWTFLTIALRESPFWRENIPTIVGGMYSLYFKMHYTLKFV